MCIRDRFGWVTENPKGITYESMGINGAEAALIQRWDEAMHAAYLKRRDPALIVLAYGTNEAGDSKWTEAGYLETFSAILQRLRRAVPASSILVLGPPDRFVRCLLYTSSTASRPPPACRFRLRPAPCHSRSH